MYKILYFIYFTTYIINSESSRILAVFPTPSISHQVVFRPLMVELTKRGHEVVVITTDPAFPKGRTPKNLIEIDVHDKSYEIWNAFMETERGSKNDLPGQLQVAFELIIKIFEAQCKTKEVQQLLKDKEKGFDIVFAEAWVRPPLVFGYLFKAPVIQFSSFGGLFKIFEEFGALSHPLIYPLAIRQRIHNLTLWEKLSELHTHYTCDSLYSAFEKSENQKLKELFGPQTPDISELKKSVQMLFLNVFPIWDTNRPVPPNVLYLGGLHQKPEKSLPKDLQTYLDSSANGVIYMSFGTNVRPSLLPPEQVRIFTKVFSQLPYDVLWKWDVDELPGRSKNTKISKWLPQSDLLKHPKIKVFITQGGLQSTDEAITAGVPLIGVPMLGDQWYNVEQYVHHKIGIQLSIDTLTEEELKSAIETVIGDKSYRENVIKLHNIMRDQPQPPLERAVWWTEYILRHGGAPHLRAPTSNIHWTQYYQADVVLTVLTVLIIIAVLIMYSVNAFWKYFWQPKKMKSQ